MKTPDSETRWQFLVSFGEGIGCNVIEADAQWAAWSRQLTDTERDQIESGGEESGIAEAAAYVAAH